MYEDIEVLNTLYTHTTRRRIQGKINDWDKRDSLEFECDYKKRGSEVIEFCDFVLRDFDHRNFAFVSAKFLFYWAKWSV